MIEIPSWITFASLDLSLLLIIIALLLGEKDD